MAMLLRNDLRTYNTDKTRTIIFNFELKSYKKHLLSSEELLVMDSFFSTDNYTYSSEFISIRKKPGNS